AGHTLVAKLLPHCDPVHKVTIIPRGPALGLTQMLPKEDRLNWNRSAILDRIAMAMGGRLAEEIEFNEITSGAKSDIDHATQFEQLVRGNTLAPLSKPTAPPVPVEPRRPEEKKSKILDALGGLGTPMPRPEPTKA